MESTDVEEAQIFPKIVFRGLGRRLESRIAGSKKAMAVSSDPLFQNSNNKKVVLYIWSRTNWSSSHGSR